MVKCYKIKCKTLHYECKPKYLGAKTFELSWSMHFLLYELQLTLIQSKYVLLIFILVVPLKAVNVTHFHILSDVPSFLNLNCSGDCIPFCLFCSVVRTHFSVAIFFKDQSCYPLSVVFICTVDYNLTCAIRSCQCATFSYPVRYAIIPFCLILILC